MYNTPNWLVKANRNKQTKNGSDLLLMLDNRY